MEVLFKTIFGSQLYGTNTPNSDVDYKGVFLPNLKDVLVGKAKLDSSINTSNKEDQTAKSGAGVVETEMYPLQKFVKLAMDGQTVSIDMLFAPKEYWVEFNPKWEYIHSIRHQFLSKNIRAFVGYCRTQAAKYGIKGSRLNCADKFVKFLKGVDQDAVLGVYVEDLKPLVDDNSILHIEDEQHLSYLDVCGKKFLFSTKVKHNLPSLEKFLENYGARARMAANDDGVDFKAVSHFYRACFEVEELIKTKDLKFPLKDRQFLLDVKLRKYKYIDLQPHMEDLVDEVTELVKNSDLPDKPPVDHEALILKFYNLV